MNTTAFGLLVAIPLLVMHTVIAQKTGQIVAALEMASVKLLNAIYSTAKRQLQAAA
jgi:biopolymer transport protein ExbB/TolQ